MIPRNVEDIEKDACAALDDTLIVAVEQRHIDAGVRGDWLRCPVGLALAELGAHIELPTAYIRRPDWMPVEMEKFIIAFDKGRKSSRRSS